MPNQKDILDIPIIALSDVDCLTTRDLIEGGTLITGGLGSGKSSTSARALALGFLRAGFGALVLTVKSDETAHWLEYAKLAGREKDVVLFNAENGLSFDPLAYTWNQPGRGAAYIETIIELFTTLISVGKQHSGASSGERYFEQAVEELMRAALVMLSMAGKAISINAIAEIIASLPTSPEEVEDVEWQTESACGKLLADLRNQKETFTPSQWEDLDKATSYAMKKWPRMDTRTTSNIESTWSGMASRFTFDPFRRMFSSGEYSFTPEQITHERKIVILDMPVLEVGREASRLCQILIKIICQRSWLRHQYKPGCCNGAVLFQDEFALLMHKHENQFHMVCRGSAIAPVCITTNIMGIAAEEFGEDRPGSKTLGFLGNLPIKIFHSQTDIETSNYGADQIGKEYRYIEGYSGTATLEHYHAGISGNRQLAHIVEPIEFSRLKKPNALNPFSEAIVYAAGKHFECTKDRPDSPGRNYLRVLFSREI